MSVPTAYLASDLTSIIDDFPNDGTYLGQTFTASVDMRTEQAIMGDGSVRQVHKWEICIPDSYLFKSKPKPDTVVRLGSHDYIIETAERRPDGIAWKCMLRIKRGSA